MSTTIVTPENLPAVLAQVTDRQDQLDAQIQVLIDLMAEQEMRTDRQDEQLRVQASALRATATQLSANIRQLSDRNGDGEGRSNGNAGKPRSAASGARQAGDGNGNDSRSNMAANGAAKSGSRSERPALTTVPPASEPEAPRKKAHRWT